MRRLVLGLAVVVITVLAALTRAFTLPADAVTAVALAAYLVYFVARSVRTRRAALPAAAQRDGAPPGAPEGVGFAIWILVAVVAIGFEVANYFLLPRSAHPTASSFFSFVAAHSWSRGLLFAGWLLLGAKIVFA